MEFQGLSTDQAPPIWVPLRFFITAPLFAILAGVLIFFSEADILSNRHSIESIVIAHIFTIGFFGFVMLGALTQMLPVLAGVKIKKVDSVSLVSYLLLSSGIAFISIGLYYNNSIFSTLAFIALGSGFFTMISAIAIGMKSVNNYTPTVKGMAVAITFAFSIVLMGLYLLYGYIFSDITSEHMHIADIHSVWGIFGFAGILIISVAFQVLPMFYVAPHFKSFCKKKVVMLVAVGLVFWLILNIALPEYSFIAKIWISLFFLAFSTTVWMKFNKRRRPISDVTVWYWRTSSIFLALGIFMWVFDEYFSHKYIVMASVFIGGGFIMSVMIGMLYKIVPFLVWFHLNSMGYMSIPTMNEMINKNVAKVQFILFVTSLIGFTFSFYYLELLKVSAICFIFSMVTLQYNIAFAIRVYIKTKKTKPDFDMSMFGDIKQ